MMERASVKIEIAALIARKDYAALKKYLEPWLPADLAPVIADLSVEELAALFRVCSRELAAAVFTYMPLAAQRKLLKALNQEQAAALLNALPPDDRTMFLNELPLDVAMQLLAMLTPDERQVAQALLGYPEHSVGRVMTARLRGGAPGVDRPRGPRLHPRARLRSRDPQHRLCHRCRGPADRRCDGAAVFAFAAGPASVPIGEIGGRKIREGDSVATKARQAINSRATKRGLVSWLGGFRIEPSPTCWAKIEARLIRRDVTRRVT